MAASIPRRSVRRCTASVSSARLTSTRVRSPAMSRGVTVSGFAIRGFSGFGVAATAASRTLIKDNFTSSNRDGGIFAAQSLDTRIIDEPRLWQPLRSPHQRSGPEASLAGNSLHDNCVGAPGVRRGGRISPRREPVRRNTRVCPPVPGEWPALSGDGGCSLVVDELAHDRRQELITGNVPGGDSDFSGGVVVAGVPGGVSSSRQLVKRNVILAQPIPTSSGTRAAPETCSETCSSGRVSHRAFATEPG